MIFFVIGLLFLLCASFVLSACFSRGPSWLLPTLWIHPVLVNVVVTCVVLRPCVVFLIKNAELSWRVLCVSLCPRGLRFVCVGFCGPTVVCDAPLCGGLHTSLPATNPIQPAVPYLLPPAHHNIVCGVVGCGLRCVTILPVSESVFTLCVHHRGLCQTTPRSTEWLRES